MTPIINRANTPGAAILRTAAAMTILGPTGFIPIALEGDPAPREFNAPGEGRSPAILFETVFGEVEFAQDQAAVDDSFEAFAEHYANFPVKAVHPGVVRQAGPIELDWDL